MSETLAQFLRAEIADTIKCLENAKREEIASGYEIDATMAREYFAGYLAGVTNALHALNGMGGN